MNGEMAIVRKFGKPDYFIAMTANPAWPEVVKNLRSPENAHDRPDIVARVFRIKFESLLADLVERQVLGYILRLSLQASAPSMNMNLPATVSTIQQARPGRFFICTRA